MKKTKLSLLILVCVFALSGCGPKKMAIDQKVYQSFLTAKTLYLGVDKSVKFTNGLANTLAASACYAIEKSTAEGEEPNAIDVRVCAGGRAWAKLYEDEIYPNMVLATEAYTDGLVFFDKYMDGTASEATLTERTTSLLSLVSKVQEIFGKFNVEVLK